MSARGSSLTRRDFLAGAAAAATVAAWPQGSGAGEPRRPNILLVESDDHHPGALGCLGHPVLQTPHIDAVAARGTVFANNICQALECVPSRASLLTGSYPHSSGVHSNQARSVAPNAWTFPLALRRSGYRCVLVGKNHLGFGAKASPGESRDEVDRAELERFGFDEAFPVNGKVWSGRGYSDDAYRRFLREKGLLERLKADFANNRTDLLTGLSPSPLEPEDTLDAFIAGQAIQWLEAYRGDEPFLLWINFVSPHTPCDAPLPYARLYDPKDMPEPIAAELSEYPAGVRQLVQTYQRKVPPGFSARFRAAYYGMISFVDTQVGRLLEALERRQLLDDTLVVFCGDQGQMAGDHGIYTKSVFFRGSVGTPLVVSWPAGGLRSGARVTHPVELQDLVPTFLELAGSSDEDRLSCFGRSLLPVLKRGAAPSRDAAFAEKWSWKMIATPDHKYVYHRLADARQLFDLRADPDERRNLAGEPGHAAVERKLRERVLAWLSDTWRLPNSGPPAGEGLGRS